MYQIHKRDSYNQSSIESSSNNLEDAVNVIKDLVTEDNFSNALVLDQKLSESEAYALFFADPETDEIVNHYVYAGPTGTGGKHKILVIKNDQVVEKIETSDFSDVKNVKPRFYLGTDKTNEKKGVLEDHFLKSVNNAYIEDVNDVQIEDKDVYYISKI